MCAIAMNVARRLESDLNSEPIGPRSGAGESSIGESASALKARSPERRLAATDQQPEQEADAGGNRDGVPRLVSHVGFGIVRELARALERVVLE